MNLWAIKALPYVAIALLLLFSKSTYDGRRRAEGVSAVRADSIRTARAELKVVRDSLQTAMRAEVETLRVAVVRRVPVRDTVERWLRDTVPVPVEVVREIVRVDSVVIAACSTALTTCAQRAEVLEADLLLSQQQTALWQRRARPSLLTQLSTAGKWLAVGFLIGVTR
jgi:hypothetical protein